MSKLMELVEEYGFECLHSGDDEQRILFEIRAKVQALERDAARYKRLRRGVCITEIDEILGRPDDYDADIDARVDAAIDAAMLAARPGDDQ